MMPNTKRRTLQPFPHPGVGCATCSRGNVRSVRTGALCYGVLTLLLLTALLPVDAQPSPAGNESLNPTIDNIPFEGELTGWRLDDLDGVPGDDLILSLWSRARGRELWIYMQRHGRFGEAPDRRIPLMKDIIAFSSADVRAEPGLELLFFTRQSCFSYSCAHESFSGNAQRLFRCPLIYDLPQSREAPYFPVVLDSKTLFLPTVAGIQLWQRNESEASPNSKYSEQQTLELGPRSSQSNTPSGFSVSLGMQLGGGYQPVPESGGGFLNNFLVQQRWHAAPLAVDVDDDQQSELVWFDAGSIHTYSATPPSADSPGSPVLASFAFDREGETRLIDLDNDGHLDLLTDRSDSADEHILTFTLRRDGDWEQEPRGLLKYGGFAVRPWVRDLDADGQCELVLATFDIENRLSVGNVRVTRNVYVHEQDAARVFSRRPASRHTQNLDMQELERAVRPELLQQGSTCYFVTNNEQGELALSRWRGVQLSEKSTWTYRQDLRVRELHVIDLEHDHYQDLLLLHSDRLRIIGFPSPPTGGTQ